MHNAIRPPDGGLRGPLPPSRAQTSLRYARPWRLRSIRPLTMRHVRLTEGGYGRRRSSMGRPRRWFDATALGDAVDVLVELDVQGVGDLQDSPGQDARYVLT